VLGSYWFLGAFDSSSVREMPEFSPEDCWFLILGLVGVDVKLVVLGVCTVLPGS
jgi:hypothetical protein